MSDAPVRPCWLGSSGPGNLNVPPEKWSMTLDQWAAFLLACLTSDRSGALKDENGGYINLYQINDVFVKPWTRGTGNGIALLMNAHAPLKAEVMISHCWGECIQQALTALLGRASNMGLPLSCTAIWFCIFAQYQAGDMEGDCGPSVAEQLALDPFKCVIDSMPRYGMLVIHTSTYEAYDRLWCVHEINTAHEKGVATTAALSMKYMQIHLGNGKVDVDSIAVDTDQATCWSADDEARIRSEIVEAGGYDELNEKITAFRKSSLESMAHVMSEFVEWCSRKMGEDIDSIRDAIAFNACLSQDGAYLLGLHCLWPRVERCGDFELGEKILGEASLIISRISEGLVSMIEDGDVPPHFDASKIGWMPDTNDVEKVKAILRDIRLFPAAIGFLQFGSGGSVTSMLIFERLRLDTDEINRIFSQFDTDGNGVISKEELSSVLVDLNPALTDVEILMIFSCVDVDNDGNINYEDFAGWLMTSFA